MKFGIGFAAAFRRNLYINGSNLGRDESGRPERERQRCGTTVISRSAAMRYSKGGCVLNSGERVLSPNVGWEMRHDERVAGTGVVDRSLLECRSFGMAL